MIQILSKKCFTDIEEFQIDKTKTIGKGSFGVVRLGLHKGTNKVYAIKIIDLNHIERPYQLKLIEREINLHSSLNHPHIIKLWDTILNKNMVYLVMEYAQCGNLFHHQNTKLKFSEAQTFRFFYQIAKAVQYMHEQDTIHRDIKPENILLDKHGCALLADFGWSARGIFEQRSTFCGTYEYMAPQMIAKQSYNYKVDVWSIGVFLYEMLHGNAPFTGQTLSEVQKKIQKGQYGIYSGLSQEVKALIREILQFNPLSRPSVKDILNHDWVKKMESEINCIVKKELIKNPANISAIISKISATQSSQKEKPKVMHKKTESAINMFGVDDDKKDEDFETYHPQESKEIKKRKIMKTLTRVSTKKLTSQRTQSPMFSAKQNLEAEGRIQQKRIIKHRRYEHMRLMTQISDKLKSGKSGSSGNLKAASKNSQDKRQDRKRARLRDVID